MTKLLALEVPGGQYNFEPIAGMPEGPRDIPNLITFGITSLFIIATLLCLFVLIWAGIQWITSGGDKAGIDKARKRITFAIVGLVVTFSAYLILSVVGNIVGVNPLDPRCGPDEHFVSWRGSARCEPNN